MVLRKQKQFNGGATMKSYTDLEQSKKLAEILPLESADMAYWKKSYRPNDYAIMAHHTKELQEGFEAKGMEYITCWSLAALLDVLPYTIKLSHDTIDVNGNPAYKNESYKFSINRCGLFGDKWNIQYYGKHQRQLGKRYKELYIDLFLTENYDKLIDACYEMILKLHEQKVL